VPSFLVRRGCRLALFAALALAPTLPAHALDLNGFFPAKGQTDIAISYTTESYDHFYRGTVKRPNPPFLGKVTNKTTTLWARHGLTDRLALIANLPYVDSSGDGTDHLSETSLQDLTAMLEFKAFESGSSVRNRVVVAVGGRTPASDYIGDSPVSIGDHSTDELFRLVYQLEAGRFYFSQQVGYDLRSGDVPDGYPVYTEAGYTVGRVTVNGFYQRYFADGGSDIGDPGFTFTGNKDELQRVGAKLFARVTRPVGVFVAGFTTLDGRNTGYTTGYSAGFTLGF